MTQRDSVRHPVFAALLGAVLCMFLPVSGWTQTATQGLLQKASSLEKSGHIDLAALTWQQVLLVDPANEEALAGLARAAKRERHGEGTPAGTEGSRTRTLRDPNLARVGSTGGRAEEQAELEAAERSAAAGQYTQAMRLYRAVFGSTPPPGDPALGYYETEAATEEGRPHAVAGLRALVARYPADRRYKIALARVLTYSPKTRAEGRRMLQHYPEDGAAVEALRQALVWDAQNPASAGDLRAYLALHPDPQLEELSKSQGAPVQGVPVQVAPESRTRARTAPANTEEQTAYQNLKAGDIGHAEALFRGILERHPASGSALAGMGYVRMQQGDFGGAISFLTQARQKGVDDAGLAKALETARFWYTMGEGMKALAQNDVAAAEKQYQAALGLRPNNPEALDGLGRALLKGGHPERAEQVYVRFTRSQPTSAAAWRGLLQAQVGSGDAEAALVTNRAIPSALHDQMVQNPSFLGALATAYSANGQEDEAGRVLDDALDLPFPPGGQGIEPEAQLDYGSLLLQAGHFDQAAGLYRQVLAGDRANASAWVGLARVQHAQHDDVEALRTVESIPPATYAAALRDAGFDAVLAEIFQAEGKLDTAQSVLEQSIAREREAGETVSVDLEIELARVHLGRKQPESAYAIYQGVLAGHPDRLDAWKGLFATLHAGGRDRDALTQIQQMTTATRVRLETDSGYLRTVAAIYQALGQPGEASVFLTRVLQVDVMHQAPPDVEVEIENAGLLLKAGDEAALYAELQTLDGRANLTGEQRGRVEAIWANWAVGRAAQAGSAGDTRRSTALLDATATAFPGSRTVLPLVAEGYMVEGQPSQAVALYRRIGLAGATSAEYETALAAALSAGDTRQAQSWLREGLAAYPRDPRLLLQAAEMEQAKGSGKRAAKLYRTALAGMPTAVSISDLRGQGGSQGAAEGSPGGLGALGLLGGLLAPASATQASRYPPLPPIHPPGTAEPASRSMNRSSPSVGVSPRLRDYVPVSSNGGRPGVLRGASGTTLQRRNVSAMSFAQSEGGSQVVRGATDAGYGPFVAYVPSASRVPDPAQADAARTGQSHPPEDEVSPSVSSEPYSSSAVSVQAARGGGRPEDKQSKQSTRSIPWMPVEPGSGTSLPERTQPPRSATVDSREIPEAVPSALQWPSLSYPSPRDAVADASRMEVSTAPTHLRPALRPDREEAELELASLEASYSGSAASAGVARFRRGTPGLDRLTDLEAPIELSTVLARTVRAAVILRGVFLDSGTGDKLAGPTILGTGPISPGIHPPVANGLGGEMQLVSANAAVAVGYTPYEFPVHNITARVRVRPGGGPVMFVAEREPVRQTQLSYAGLRDPRSPGSIWGGVVSTGAGVRLELGDARAAYSFVAHGATLTGRHVLDNTAFEATVSSDFRLHRWVRAGTLNLGGDLMAAHYTHNERGLSYGQGGYFSPNYLFVAAVPATFRGHTKTSFHYSLSGAGGFQTYQERAAPLYPLDRGLQAAALAACSPAAGASCGLYPLRGRASAHYAVDARGAYRMGNHWYLGGFLAADNTHFYDEVSTGFFVRYLFTPQVPLDGSPTGLFPTDGFLPLRVP